MMALVCAPLLMGIGSIDIRIACNGENQSYESSVYIDPDDGAGGVPGSFTSCGGPGQCPCADTNPGFGDYKLCGYCPTHELECSYCGPGTWCPIDPCGTSCPGESCPAGYPINCDNGECCPDDFPVCCGNGRCATNVLGCREDFDDDDSCSLNNPTVSCTTQYFGSKCAVRTCSSAATCQFFAASDHSATFGTECGGQPACVGAAAQAAYTYCGVH